MRGNVAELHMTRIVWHSDTSHDVVKAASVEENQ